MLRAPPESLRGRCANGDGERGRAVPRIVPYVELEQRLRPVLGTDARCLRAGAMEPWVAAAHRVEQNAAWWRELDDLGGWRPANGACGRRPSAARSIARSELETLGSSRPVRRNAESALVITPCACSQAACWRSRSARRTRSVWRSFSSSSTHSSLSMAMAELRVFASADAAA
jgi:hypothetical protein